MKIEGASLIVGVVFLGAVFIYNFIISRKRRKSLKQSDSVMEFNKKYRRIDEKTEEYLNQSKDDFMKKQFDFIEKDTLHERIQSEINGIKSPESNKKREFKF